MKIHDHQVLPLQKEGSASAASNVVAAIVPFDGFISAVLALFGVGGTNGTGSPTQDLLVDVNKNGTTLIASTKLTWARGSAGAAIQREATSYGSFVGAAPIAVLKGDVLSVDFDQVLNGTNPVQPINLVVAVKVTRNSRPLPANILTGTLE